MYMSTWHWYDEGLEQFGVDEIPDVPWGMPPHPASARRRTMLQALTMFLLLEILRANLRARTFHAQLDQGATPARELIAHHAVGLGEKRSSRMNAVLHPL
jgi:hypothetical protein